MPFDNWLARPKQLGPNEIVAFVTNQNQMAIGTKNEPK
jgi:hypothetical protein